MEVIVQLCFAVASANGAMDTFCLALATFWKASNALARLVLFQ